MQNSAALGENDYTSYNFHADMTELKLAANSTKPQVKLAVFVYLALHKQIAKESNIANTKSGYYVQSRCNLIENHAAHEALSTQKSFYISTRLIRVGSTLYPPVVFVRQQS